MEGTVSFTPTILELKEENNLVVDRNLNCSNPWPRLEKLYCLKSVTNQNLKYECILCRPKKVCISTCITSSSNLRKHVKVSFLQFVYLLFIYFLPSLLALDEFTLANLEVSISSKFFS